jgi:hypothetical protein
LSFLSPLLSDFRSAPAYLASSGSLPLIHQFRLPLSGFYPSFRQDFVLWRGGVMASGLIREAAEKGYFLCLGNPA